MDSSVGHSVTVAVLSSHAATDIDARDAELRTPLHWVIKKLL